MVNLRRIDAEIDDVERQLAQSDERTSVYSDHLRRLTALQQERRSVLESG
jgi:hypothetical protein